MFQPSGNKYLELSDEISILENFAISHQGGVDKASKLLRLSLPALLQIEVESARPKHWKLGRVHSTHHHVLGHFSKMVKDGLGIVDHGDRRHASIHHLAQLHVLPHTGHRQHRAFDSGHRRNISLS